VSKPTIKRYCIIFDQWSVDDFFI